MGLSLYDVSVPPFIHALKALSAVLEKGKAHAAGKEETLTEARLIADMGALTYQIQRISDTAKGLAVRAGKAEPLPMEDNEKTFDELLERLKKTIAYLEKLSPQSMDGMEEAEIVMKTGSGDRKFTGKGYVLFFATPNFYFHESMAYAILRKEGVQIGKKDFLGA